VAGKGEAQIVRPAENLRELAFCGIHIISPQFLELLEEQGAFSIIDVYLRLAPRERILAFPADGCYWRDLGRPESVVQASQDFADKVLTT
jgi:NDP-sugar pyrophosphorylase family protein